MRKRKWIGLSLIAVLAMAVYAFVPPAPGVRAATPATVTYTYDSLGRIRTDVPSSGNSGAYAYDNAGNRTTATLN